MRRFKLDELPDYQKHLKEVHLNPFYTQGDASKANLQEYYYILVWKISEINNFKATKPTYASEASHREIVKRHMLFHVNFFIDFAFIKPNEFEDLYSSIEEWMLNEKAYMGSDVTVHDNDGQYIVEGLLDLDSEYEDDRYVICKVFDYNLACALQIFLNWFHSEITYYEKFRYVR